MMWANVEKNVTKKISQTRKELLFLENLLTKNGVKIKDVEIKEEIKEEKKE